METPPLPFSISTRDMNIFESRHINIFEHLETPYLLRKWLTSRTDEIFWGATKTLAFFAPQRGRINTHFSGFFEIYKIYALLQLWNPMIPICKPRKMLFQSVHRAKDKCTGEEASKPHVCIAPNLQCLQILITFSKIIWATPSWTFVNICRIRHSAKIGPIIRPNIARISTQLEKNHMFHKRDRQICCQNICHILKW